MTQKTINGSIKIFYPFDKDDVINDSFTDEQKIAKANDWNTDYESDNDYKIKRKSGKATSSLNNTTGKRENIVKQSGYDLIGEQLDKLWHDIDEGKLDKTGSFYTSIKTIKDRWSKT